MGGGCGCHVVVMGSCMVVSKTVVARNSRSRVASDLDQFDIVTVFSK